MRQHSENGFTLVELVMVMAVFSVVIMMVGSSFSTILKYSTRFMKSEESTSEGNVGLEVLRHDIASVGFGLPTLYGSTSPIYPEAAGSATAILLNDAPPVAPRAIVGKNDLGAVSDTGSDGLSYTTLAGSDYLALKATSLGTQVSAQKWTYATYSSIPRPPKTWSTGNLKKTDQVIVVSRSNQDYVLSFPAGSGAASASYYSSFPDPAVANQGLAPGLAPGTPQDMAYIYGVADAGPLRMPFNRADFFVATPPAGKLPTYCAPNTGVLYRAMVRHADGALEYQPLMDCVANMQVVLGWSMLDPSGTSVVTDPAAPGGGMIDTWTNVDGTAVSSTIVPLSRMQTAVASAADIRTKLKVVKVYLLVQDGKKDPSYTSPGTSRPFQLYDPAEGGQSVGKSYTLPADLSMSHYRWKVYKVVVQPKNLIANQ